MGLDYEDLRLIEQRWLFFSDCLRRRSEWLDFNLQYASVLHLQNGIATSFIFHGIS
jgi:hypothetical protein